jgi:hypothetical protein
MKKSEYRRLQRAKGRARRRAEIKPLRLGHEHATLIKALDMMQRDIAAAFVLPLDYMRQDFGVNPRRKIVVDWRRNRE